MPTPEQSIDHSEVDLNKVDANTCFVFVVPPEDGKGIWETMGDSLIRGGATDGPDRLIFELPGGQLYIEGEPLKLESWVTRTTFFPTSDGLLCPLPGEELVMGVDLTARPDFAQMFEAFSLRNQLAGFIPPTISREPTQSTEEFVIHTSQECDVWMKSVGHGKGRIGWRNEEQRGVRVYEQPGASHRVELDRYQEDEEGEGLTFDDLEELTGAQSIDSAFALFYICGVLSPPGTEKHRLVGGWIDLNDVMRNIGWLREKPNAERREELRAKIWEFLRHGARARVVGERSVKYFDKSTKEIISTQIDSTPWKITDTERPKGNINGTPVRAHVVISQQWMPLLTSPHLSQYMPLGELLASIPPGKVAGDWARTMSLALARLWRIKPREAELRLFSPTRRELLMTFTPKTSPEEVLKSDKPKRAVEYYRDSLQYLAEGGFIAREGDAAKDVTATSMLVSYGRQGWVDAWLNGSSGIYPGAGWQPANAKNASALPPLKPKDLKTKPRQRRKSRI